MAGAGETPSPTTSSEGPEQAASSNPNRSNNLRMRGIVWLAGVASQGGRPAKGTNPSAADDSITPIERLADAVSYQVCEWTEAPGPTTTDDAPVQVGEGARFWRPDYWAIRAYPFADAMGPEWFDFT